MSAGLPKLLDAAASAGVVDVEGGGGLVVDGDVGLAVAVEVAAAR